jgi:type II secretory pathway pseudopilin PulG
MSMNDFNSFDDTLNDEADAPEESNNRTFLLVAGGLGVVVLLAMLCLGGYVLFNYNTNQTNQEAAQAQATIQEATVQAALTQTAIAQAQAQALEATTTAIPPTNTPVISQATTTPTETPNPATATVGAAFTQIAVSTQTVIATSTALPNTGFADDVGIPGMFAVTLGLIILIFMVRRLRAVPAR